MESDSSRRYTDREVAIVLRRAAEIEEVHGTGSGQGGLSRTDLEEIAVEVGISREAVSRALDELSHRREPGSLLTGMPRMHRAVRAVPGALGEEGMSRLVRLVDERAEGAGVISEALGSVRWTSSDRLHNTQVSLTPLEDETSIQVVEKTNARFKVALHAVPAAWGVIAAAGVVSSIGLVGLPLAGVFVAGAAVGGGAGRLVWNLISSRSAHRVERLAAELSREAIEAAPKER